MKLVLDEMLPPAIAIELRSRGHDAIAVVERAELRSLDDRAQLAAATADDRVLVTRNIADYVELDREYRAQGAEHAGIFLVRRRYPFEAVGALVNSLDEVIRTDAAPRGLMRWV